MVMAGSLSEGLTVRLDPGQSVEAMAVGRYVTIEGARRRFFGMVTDVALASIDPRLAVMPPDVSDDFIAEVVAGTSTFGTIAVTPMLTIDRDGVLSAEGPAPVKTVPTHFSPVRDATEQDMAVVFGQEDERHFAIGTPLDMETKVCLDMRRLVERSSGVFGKSGTGKTFLTRLLLIGMIQKSAAVSLIFDMHNDYGWEGTAQGEHTRSVKGLRQLFGGQVAIFTLDERSTTNRGASPDYVVQIGYEQIEPEDFALLQEALDMTQAQIESVHRLARQFGKHWFTAFLKTTAEEREQIAQAAGLNPNTLQVLHRKMETRLARLPFLCERPLDDSLKRMLDYLARGIHIVLEFGRHGSLDAYILVANILTRRIHDHYVEQKERALGDRAMEPKPLVIVIEEAHKFLNPEVAGQTIFGTIAREMRKYNVTLLVVDQRPSGIDEEVMSQIGTRITCLLDNERDVESVLSGVAGAKQLRSVLARLDSQRQALIFGYAVPMPVVVKTAEYGSAESYARYGLKPQVDRIARGRQAADELFPT
ncbi:MAG: ATP-binding protein [Chloroflexi bacterium]|nr:ATP-binding protein [Chloroflexota bacterium]